MSGLAIIVVGADVARARTALGIAAAAAALGRDTAVLFDGASVGCLDALREALATTLALGVRITACATGVADLGLPLPESMETGGLIGFLAANRDAQLLTV